MKTKNVTLIMLCMLLFACDKQVAYNDISNKKNNGSYVIPVNQAIDYLDAFLDADTKSEYSDRQIANIVTVMADGTMEMTKSGESYPLLYIINYTDNEGYAIISADKRIGNDVFAITESGNINENYSCYDTLNSEKLPLELVRRYAINASSTIPIRDSLVDDNYFTFPRNDDDPPEFTVPDGEWVITVWDRVETVNAVPVMLQTKWNQNAPFNNLCRPYAAGCTAVAMMQIMTYNAYPSPFIIEDVTIPFEELREMKYVLNDSSIYAKAVALIVKSIRDYCGVTHLGTSSLIWPKHAAKYFKNVMGYSNVQRYADPKRCDVNMIIDCLMKGYPVFVAAKANGFHAHSWVVDGLIYKNYYGHKEGEESGDYKGEAYKSEAYFHCNWGWGGKDDGYFKAGIFDTDISYDFDYMTKSESDGDYDSYYRIITYEVQEG